MINQSRRRVTVQPLGACCRFRYSARVIKIERGQKKVYELRFGAKAIRPQGREEPLHLPAMVGLGKERLLLVSNPSGVRDSQSPRSIVQIDLTRAHFSALL